MTLRFEWARKKAVSNLDKHGVSFEEAVTVFADPLARIFDDEAHSETEPREIIVGHSGKQRVPLLRLPNGPTPCAFSACAGQREGNERIMKAKSSRKRSPASKGDLRREYAFDYSKSRPNRFAAEFKDAAVAVVLDPDVAAVFRSSESVNSLLRSVIAALPEDVHEDGAKYTTRPKRKTTGRRLRGHS
jgi:hypothetical protein